MPLSLNGFEDNSVITRGEMNAESPFFLSISMTFLPDNRMLLLSKDGEILIVDPETGNSETYMKLQNIDTGRERGLLDITLDPDFEDNGYFYLYYTPNSPERATISRFQHQENSGGLTSEGTLASETVLWQDTDGYLSCCHYGGGLDFGPDGKIWLTTSDKFQSTTPGERPNTDDIMLDLGSTSGKIVRINADGTIPDGTDGWAANPYIDGPGGNADSVWAYGLRNPFRAEWDEEYGYMYIGEVGGNQQNLAHEDIHLASLDQPGAFYGWPFYEGTPNTYVNQGLSSYDPDDFPSPDGDLADPANGDEYSAPIWSLDHQGQTASLTGGEVYRGDMFPSVWNGVYFYGDYTRDYINYLVLDSTGTQVVDEGQFLPSSFGGSTNEVVSINVGEDGALYYAMINSGEVRRVTYGDNEAPVYGSVTMVPQQGDLPLTVQLSATVSDPDNDAMTYFVNYGDGTTASGSVVNGTINLSHTYNAIGAYDVQLSVSDGTVTAFAQAFEVEAGGVNDPPVIESAQVDLSIIDTGSPVMFTATTSDPENDALTYVWNFGDGNSASGNVNPDGTISVTHTYTTEDTFQAFLEVSDPGNTVFSNNIPIVVGEPTEVPVTSGLSLLLESDIKIGLGAGNTVTGWLDGSGNGNNLSAQGDPQLTANATPTGEASILFDGTGDLLERVDATDELFNLPSGNADRSIFYVVDYIDNEGVSSGVAYGDNAGNQTFGLVAEWDDGNLGVQGFGGPNDFDSGVDGLSGGFMVQSVILDDNAYIHYKDGQIIDSGNHVFNTDVERLILGGEIGDKGQSELQISAVLVYNRAVTENERLQIEEYLQTKYITGSTGGGGNQDPNAVNDSYATDEDTALVINAANGVLDNDSDPDTDPLTAAEVSGPSNGNLTLNANGSFTYTPDQGFSGQDSFTYSANDGNGGSDTATVTITVNPDNSGGGGGDLPVLNGLVGSFAADENVSTGAGTTVTGWLDGSGLGNDLVSVGDPQLEQGSTPTGLPSIVFDGDADILERINATDGLTGFSDGNEDRTIFFVVDYIDNNGISAGVAYGDSASNEAFGLVSEWDDADLGVQGYGIANDHDSDVPGLAGGFIVQSVVLNNDQYTHYLNGGVIDSGTHVFNTDLKKLVLGGELKGKGEGEMKIASVLIYNRALNETERQDVEAYLQDKWISGTGGGGNQDPNAVNDSYATDEDTALVINAANGVLDNDSDPDTDPLTAAEVSGPSNGNLTLNANGSFTYTPNQGFSGQDSFTYSAS
ncbi:MAG: Ig-like domain-containing protein, partial [Pseudomonadota bacterium]